MNGQDGTAAGCVSQPNSLSDWYLHQECIRCIPAHDADASFVRPSTACSENFTDHGENRLGIEPKGSRRQPQPVSLIEFQIADRTKAIEQQVSVWRPAKIGFSSPDSPIFSALGIPED